MSQQLIERIAKLEERVDQRFDMLTSKIQEQTLFFQNHLAHHERLEDTKVQLEKDAEKQVERRHEKTSERVFKLTLLILNIVSTAILTFLFAYYKMQ